ncbi:MAG: TldD/PmbA family protein [Clostridia bacterium]|nr:TldD/PmbA family protein [Clostridia bacterium]MBQ1934636.1 TldD/PmbA family protein [Clostridia bacterium]MBQ5809851.1 TldD/PmbA family protein [Clostridia bacterium]
MNFELLKKAIAESAAELGITEYEIYYESEASVSAETLKDEISSLSSNVSGALDFRCVVDGKMGFASTELMEVEEMRKLPARAAENAKYTDKPDTVGIFKGSESYGTPNAPAYKPMTPEEIRKTALDIQSETYKVSDKVTDGTQSAVSTGEMTVRMVNSHGLDLQASSGINFAYAVAVVNDNGEFQDSFAMTELGKKSFAELSAEAVNTALEKVGSGSVATGKYNIIIDAKQMRTILAVFSNAFSAKTAQAGMSLLAGKEGEKIAADIVNITDDPMREGIPVQIPFDGEGVAAYRKDVVKNGVLQTLLYNRATAAKAGCETTGNSSKGGNDIRPYAFAIEAGDKTEAELFEMAQNGIYVTEVKGLHAGANPVTGDFSIESAGFLIEGGKRTKPVKSFTIAGNFFQLIKDIKALSNEVDFSLSGGYTTFGSPAVLIENMSVAGK